MACKCYHAERNFVGKIGVCWGTKECEACSCGGDESKCDFYEDKRKKATPKTTNYDLFISKTPEVLAMICSEGCPPSLYWNCTKVEIIEGESVKEFCQRCWIAWLKSPVDKEEEE